MAQSDHQILTHSKAYLFATFAMLLLTIGYLATAQLFSALLSAGISLTLVLLRWPPSRMAQWQGQHIMKGCTLVLAALTLLLLWRDAAGISPWLFSAPLLIFFIFEFKPAMWCVGTYTLIMSLILGQHYDALHNTQFAWQFILLMGVTFSLVYLRELRQRQLKPLRRTDNLTMAATREHLDDDLTKEIQRSEREGSDLAVMALAVDPLCLSRMSNKEKDVAAVDIGRLLHNNLRLFDSYYLWQAHQFLIVLPHTNSAQALKIANALRVKVKKEITMNQEAVTISVGISGLNVGDDSASVCQRAAQALQKSQDKGENRTQLFREDSADASDDRHANDAGDEPSENPEQGRDAP